jgi:hypothetical protein
MKGIRFRVKGLGFRFLYVVGMWFRFLQGLCMWYGLCVAEVLRV